MNGQYRKKRKRADCLIVIDDRVVVDGMFFTLLQQKRNMLRVLFLLYDSTKVYGCSAGRGNETV